MTIVIFGATGQLGRHVLDALRDREVAPSDIRAVGRNTERLAELKSQGYETSQTDLDDPQGVRDAVRGAERVLLISASEPGKRLAQHRTVVDAVKEEGISHLVYTSILGAPSTDHVLAAEHIETERLIGESGVPATFLRNGWYTENYLPVFEAARQSSEIANASHDGRVASAPRADYAEAAAVVLTQAGHEGRAYELSGDSAWDFEEFARTAGRVLGREVRYRAISQDEERQMLEDAGLDAGTAGFVAQLSADTGRDLLAATPGDLARLIGRPTQPLEETLRGW
ncbi:SDR family oxidoreductase [Mariniluteicoccus endophyticus]